MADLAGAAVKRADGGHAAGEDGEVAEGADGRQIADQPVDDEPGDATVACLGADEIPEHRGEGRGTRVHDHHVAGLGDVEALVDHEVVAGVDLDRTRGTDHAVYSRHRPNRRDHRVEPVHLIGDRRGVEPGERLY